MIWRSKPLAPLPNGQGWWVLQSIIESNEQRWRIFHLAWGVNAEDAAQHYAEDAAALDATLMQSAIDRGDIVDEHDWEPSSNLIEHEKITRVHTMRDVKKLDRGLADMLREHDGFASEIENDGPSVIGGGFYEV